MECELHELDALPHVLGCEHDVAVVAVPAATRGLVIVTLTARHVEDHERQLGQRRLGERLLHERDALAGRAGRGARTGGQRAPGHADGFELRLGVDAHAPHRRQQLGEVLEHFGERRHRVPGEELAIRGDRGAHEGLRALHQRTVRHGGRAHGVTPVTSVSTGVT
jgi:hypothetical protein